MSVTFNFREANWNTDSTKKAVCDASATIVNTTSTDCSIQITATGYWYKTDGSSPYYIHSPGVVADFVINSQGAGDKINLIGNAAPKGAALNHISATIAWEYKDGYAKFWDSSKNTYTITSNPITVNRTSSAQTIAWSATFFPSMDNVKKHSTGWTVSGTVTVPALEPTPPPTPPTPPPSPSYNIYINLDGGTWNGHTTDQVIQLKSGDTQSMPVPTKKGYIFGGWAWTTHGTMDKSQFACSVLSYEPAHGVQVYNNLGSGTVTHTYISGSNDKEKYDNDYIMIKTTGAATPGLGGFRQTVMVEYNTTYYHTFYAKLPVGYWFRAYNNNLPDGSAYQWLTNNEGTGQWQMYAYKLTTGSPGDRSTFGFIAVHPSPGSPSTVTWYLGVNQITKSPTSSQTFTAGEGDTWIYPLWIPQGTIQIWTGSFWASALPFIYTGTTKGWVQAMPYIYANDTDKWKLCGG